MTILQSVQFSQHNLAIVKWKNMTITQKVQVRFARLTSLKSVNEVLSLFDNKVTCLLCLYKTFMTILVDLSFTVPVLLCGPILQTLSLSFKNSTRAIIDSLESRGMSYRSVISLLIGRSPGPTYVGARDFTITGTSPWHPSKVTKVTVPQTIWS